MALLQSGQSAFGTLPSVNFAPTPSASTVANTTPSPSTSVPNLGSNSSLGAGLSINSGGNVLLNGQTPPNVPYTPPTPAFQPSAAAMQLLGPQAPAVTTTSTGGQLINHTNLPPQPNTAIGSNESNTYQSPNGGSVQVGQNGISNVTAAPSYSIDTSDIPSDAFSSNSSIGDVMGQQASYSDLVNAVSAAQGYSPAYLQAQTGVYNAQAQGAQLGVNQASYANQAYGNNQANNGAGLNNGNLGGATTDYVSGTISGEQSANAIQQSLNTQQQTEANINLNTQQLARTGAISAAQTQLQYSPTGMEGANQIQSVNALSNQYPTAGILPTDSIEVAQQKIANSPAYQSQFLTQVSLPGGGIEYVNKNQIVTNTSGTQTLISSADAANASAAQSTIGQLTPELAQVQGALTTAGQNFPLLLQSMQSAGINDFSSPLANQLQQSATAKVNGSLASYNALVLSLQATYSQINARGGTVDDTTRNAAAQLLNGTLSYNDLSKLYTTLTAEGNNVAQGYQSQIAQQTQTLNQIYGSGTPISGAAQQGSAPVDVSQMNF